MPNELSVGGPECVSHLINGNKACPFLLCNGHFIHVKSNGVPLLIFGGWDYLFKSENTLGKSRYAFEPCWQIKNTLVVVGCLICRWMCASLATISCLVIWTRFEPISAHFEWECTVDKLLFLWEKTTSVPKSHKTSQDTFVHTVRQLLISDMLLLSTLFASESEVRVPNSSGKPAGSGGTQIRLVPWWWGSTWKVVAKSQTPANPNYGYASHPCTMWSISYPVRQARRKSGRLPQTCYYIHLCTFTVYLCWWVDGLR